MTDNDIIKALECIASKDVVLCKKCPYRKYHLPDCQRQAATDAIDLINRQKAEIEEYPIKTLTGSDCMICSKTSHDYDNLVVDIQSEAIKEFAERLKESLEWRTEPIDEYDIDELVKEMTEGE